MRLIRRFISRTSTEPLMKWDTHLERSLSLSNSKSYFICVTFERYLAHFSLTSPLSLSLSVVRPTARPHGEGGPWMGRGGSIIRSSSPFISPLPFAFSSSLFIPLSISSIPTPFNPSFPLRYQYTCSLAPSKTSSSSTEWTRRSTSHTNWQRTTPPLTSTMKCTEWRIGMGCGWWRMGGGVNESVNESEKYWCL